jgi:Flagellar filament outer layer protein Flaa
MKRLFVIVVVGLLLGGTALFADTSVLIDFSKLNADTTVGTQTTPTENGATLIDYSNVAGASFTDAEKAIMKSSLAIDNWGVELASSARTITNLSDSYTKEAKVSATAKPFNGQDLANKVVMGVRVHFPLDPYNSWAMVTPPFDIPAYADKTGPDGVTVAPADKGMGTKFENGYGVVKNVGVLKSLSITVYGSNFPNGLGIVVGDQDGNQQTLFMDYLDFDGWRTLTWNNPNYITDVRNRELRRYPLYPQGEPFVKLIGLVIYRDAQQPGGDLVTYFKDISITYDKAILNTQRDINDEAVWGILQQRQEARRLAEVRRLGNIQVLRFLEKEKMDAGQQQTAPAAGTTKP